MLPIGFTLVPWNFPWIWSWTRLCWNWPLLPPHSAHSALPSPLFKGWDKPAAPRAPEAKRGKWCLILFCLSSFLHSLLMTLSFWAGSSVQVGEERRASGAEALQGQKMWIAVERCKLRITDLMTVLWYWPVTHTVLYYPSIHHSVQEIIHYLWNPGALLTQVWWIPDPGFPVT